MFFVGATGQILTLLLTVFLPFVFFITGHRNIDIENRTESFQAQTNTFFEISIDSDALDFVTYFKAELSEFKIRIKPSVFGKFPIVWKKVICETPCFYHTGNKAPPSFYFYMK